MPMPAKNPIRSAGINLNPSSEPEIPPVPPPSFTTETAPETAPEKEPVATAVARQIGVRFKDHSSSEGTTTLAEAKAQAVAVIQQETTERKNATVPLDSNDSSTTMVGPPRILQDAKENLEEALRETKEKSEALLAEEVTPRSIPNTWARVPSDAELAEAERRANADTLTAPISTRTPEPREPLSTPFGSGSGIHDRPRVNSPPRYAGAAAAMVTAVGSSPSGSKAKFETTPPDGGPPTLAELKQGNLKKYLLLCVIALVLGMLCVIIYGFIMKSRDKPTQETAKTNTSANVPAVTVVNQTTVQVPTATPAPTPSSIEIPKEGIAVTLQNLETFFHQKDPLNFENKPFARKTGDPYLCYCPDSARVAKPNGMHNIVGCKICTTP